MIDFGTAKILSHWRNIQRCVTLLATELTELERQYLHKRIAEERAELERLQGTQRDLAGAVIALPLRFPRQHRSEVDDLVHDLFDRVAVEAAVLEELRRPAIQPVSQFLDGLHVARFAARDMHSCDFAQFFFFMSPPAAASSMRRASR
jgi:hypothetical protein